MTTSPNAGHHRRPFLKNMSGSVSETEISCETYIEATFKRFHESHDQKLNRIEPVDSSVLIIILPEIHRLRAQTTKRPWIENRSCITTSFPNRKISEDLKVMETKPLLFNQQCTDNVYVFKCNLYRLHESPPLSTHWGAQIFRHR